MKFSENWLREWVDTGLSLEEICARLSLAGLEVETVERDAAGGAIVKLDLTPNRGDCNSMLGVAREVAALTGAQLRPPAKAQVPADIEDVVEVDIRAPQRCPRYCARVLRGVQTDGETPQWMVQRLEECGLRSLGLVVDVTNFVLLELGQPLHAFDLGKISQKLIVRMANGKEKLTLLNGQEVQLDADTLVIADAESALAMAGIMGGAQSGISEGSRDIVLESALFEPVALAGCARRYGLHTDASHRFERGVDWQLQRQAVERASELLVECAGARAGPVCEVVSEEHLPESGGRIHLGRQSLERVLGVLPGDGEQVSAWLGALQMDCTADSDGWEVVAPSHRYDIACEADLIEEVARMHGYDNLPVSLPGRDAAGTGAQDEERYWTLCNYLQAMDYSEAVSYSFIDPKLAAASGAAGPVISNPMSEDMSVMRTSLLPGLARAAVHNLARQQPRVRFFEIGMVFSASAGGLPGQSTKLGMLVAGSRNYRNWADVQEDHDFYDLRGSLETLFHLHRLGEVQLREEPHPCYAPGVSVSVLAAGDAIGTMGLLCEQFGRVLDSGQRFWGLELDLQTLLAERLPSGTGVSRFPAVVRDLAFVLPRSVTAGQVLECARDGGAEWLAEIQIFDCYTGKPLEENQYSLGLSLVFRSADRTLTDDEVDREIATITARVQKQCRASLRE